MNNSQARRPADVYLPAFAGSPTAFDFAITAPQRQETLAQASVRTAAAAEAYARHKELHLHTAHSKGSNLFLLLLSAPARGIPVP